MAHSRPKLKTAFKKARSIGPLYTGGPIATSFDGTKLVSCVGENVILTDLTSGNEICRFAADSEQVYSLCVTPSSTHLLLFTASLALHVFELPSSPTPLEQSVQPLRVIARAHDAPVHVCKADPSSAYVATGSADGVVKVWDILRGFVTHVFKGHGGVVSALAFNCPGDGGLSRQKPIMELITACVDTKIRIFDLHSATGGKGSLKPIFVLDGHVSVPRGLDVSLDGSWLLSGGRDSVVLLWKLSNATPEVTNHKGKAKSSQPKLVKTIPILERVEALGLLLPEHNLGNSQGLQFYTGGEKGVVKVWAADEAAVVATLTSTQSSINDEQEQQRQILEVMYNPVSATLASVHADQNIFFYSLTSGKTTRQLIGYNDEIVDIALLSVPDKHRPTTAETHIALATNSSLIRVYALETLDARLLEGHTDIVLSLDCSSDRRLLASTSKDNSARIWRLNVPNSPDELWSYSCVAICEGHTESVGAVAMARQVRDGHPKFMFTGSQDRTIKMWEVADVSMVDNPVRCKSLVTLKAHEKDINSLDVSPDDGLLASGSQDRTARVYKIDYSGGSGSITALGVCKGHKRGVWCTRFSRVERVLATGSGDKTIKLWNLNDFTCVKTFEGHTNSVLRVDFITAGMQLISSASDGLVKLWNIRDEECAATLDNHEDKVWALTVCANDRTVISGAADSLLTFWEDSTEELEQEKQSKKEELVAKEQDFLNYVTLKDYSRAIELALAMEQPGRLLTLFKEVLSERGSNESVSGSESVDQVIRTLDSQDLIKLLLFVRGWNANAKSSNVAQGILYSVMKLRSATDISQAFSEEGGKNWAELLDGLLSYTERHLSRMERLVQESYILDYVLSEMDDGMFDMEDENDAMVIE